VVGLTYSADGKSIAVATLKDGVLLWNLDAPLTPDKAAGGKAELFGRRRTSLGLVARRNSAGLLK
jgi:hypothetical protein